MVLTEGASFAVSSAMTVLTFSGMQMAKPLLSSTQSMTVLGGFVSSIFFVFLLTAVGNLEKVIFGKGFQTKLYEAVFCIVVSMAAATSIHRVCATTCLMFSLVMLYSMHKISQQVHGHLETASVSKVQEKSKKKK